MCAELSAESIHVNDTYISDEIYLSRWIRVFVLTWVKH